MFLISTFVGPSSLEGVGVFAAEDVPAGTRIWQFTEGVDVRMPTELMEAIPEPLQTRIRKYCYLEEDSGQYVLCGDNAKFMNHSFEPNCDDSSGEYTVTLRDIRAGDELTCDYRTFDVESRQDGLESWRRPEEREDAIAV